MSYAPKLEANIAASAVQVAPRRAEDLEKCLQQYLDARARGERYPQQDVAWMGDELRYLERLLAARPGQLRQKVADLRQRYDAIGSGHDIQSPRGGTASADGSQLRDETPSQSLQHLATFLYPKKDRCKAEDEVRVLSAEGGLSAELSKHPVLTCMESDGPRTIVMGFGRLVSWSEEDDAAEVARERVALLELSQAGVNLMEFTRIMAEQLPQDQEGLDLVEESVAQAKETTRQAVETLSGAAAAEYDHREKLVWPGAGLVMLGGLLFCTCPSGAPALLCAAGRGALFVGATLGSMSTLSKLQMRTLEQIQERLPARSILEKPPLEQAKQIREACDEANKRLHARLDDQDAWEEEPFLSRAFAADFHVWDREVGNDLAVKRGRSDARRGDYSYVFTFNVDIPVSRAFKVVQQMSLIGSLDPGCKVMWSRPVDAASDNTHYIRYVAFAEWFYSRDFCTACHCGPANHPNEHKECYTLATSSLSDELREVEGVPKLRGEQSGHIDVVGVRLTENESGTRVEVMADVDPAAPVTYFTRVVNKRIRNHTRDAAWLIQCALKQAKDSGATVSLQE